MSELDMLCFYCDDCGGSSRVDRSSDSSGYCDTVGGLRSSCFWGERD